MPKSVAQIRDRFRAQLNMLVETGDNNHRAAKLETRRSWTMLDKNGWSGDLHDLDGMSKAFDRADNWQDFKDAIKDASAPGTSGDIIASQLQSEYLATQERAFRNRHASPCRLMLHAAARRRGHSHDNGVLKVGVLGYLENILKGANNTA